MDGIGGTDFPLNETDVRGYLKKERTNQQTPKVNCFNFIKATEVVTTRQLSPSRDTPMQERAVPAYRALVLDLA